MSGPLAGFKIVEIAGIGPGPFCGMMLADMGAEVIRVDRVTASNLGIDRPAKYDVLNRNKRSIAVDLKSPDGVETVLALTERADAMIESFRPGVAERLGIGPEQVMARNARLVYGRVTGWGQTGPLAQDVGHDINYISISGVLHAIGNKGEAPAPPLSLVGDYGGGAMFLAFGLLAGLLEAKQSGKGQVVDASIVDGSALLMASPYSLHGMGRWSQERASNLLDGGAPQYSVYKTADNKWVSVGPIEEKFQHQLYQALGIEDYDIAGQNNTENWSAIRDKLASVFVTKTRDQWCELLQGKELCFAPVLTMSEAQQYPANKAREVFTELDGVVQPSPSPRFSRTPGQINHMPPTPGEHTEEILSDWGFSTKDVKRLLAEGVVKKS
jgi:alpha-methylacyl-CoA racemase